MSYTLRLSNGKILLTLADQQTDSVTTSLTLIGKNVNAYGSDINQNYIRLLEHFASTTQPTSPLAGQLWFNTLEQRMYYYNSANQFKPVGGTTLGATEPPGLVAGDLWIDTTAGQLKFFDGASVQVAGQQYDASKGKSGWVVDEIADNTSISRTVIGLWANGDLLGILSNLAFTFAVPYPDSSGMTSCGVGLTVNNSIGSVGGIKFIGTATYAENIGGVDAQNVLTKIDDQEAYGTLAIQNDGGLSVGLFNDITFYVNTASSSRVASMSIGGTNEDFALELNSPNLATGFYFDSTNERLGIFNKAPATAVDITGNTTIRGNLTVVGTGTYVTQVDLRVNDKNIELNYNSIPWVSDTSADGGGIILKGYADKSFTWKLSNGSWFSTEHIDIQYNKSFRIGGDVVIAAGTLGATITAAPGLTSIGNLTELNVGGNRFSASGIGRSGVSDLVLGSDNTVAIDFNGRQARNLAPPTVSDSPDYVATKGYVDTAVSVARSGQFAPTIDVTGQATDPEDPNLDIYVIEILSYMLPPSDPSPYGIAENGRARVLCTRYTTPAIPNVSSNYIDFGNPVYVDQAGIQTVASVVGYSTQIRASTSLPAYNLGISRAVKQYIVSGGVWVRYTLPSSASNTVWSDGTW